MAPLRDYIGATEKPKEGSGDKAKWVRRRAEAKRLRRRKGNGRPHAIGAVMVAAVFTPFLQIYKRRTTTSCALPPEAPASCPRERSRQIW